MNYNTNGGFNPQKPFFATPLLGSESDANLHLNTRQSNQGILYPAVPQYSAPDGLAKEIESYDPTNNPFAATAKEQISRRLPSPPTQPLVHPYQVSHQSIMAQNPQLQQPQLQQPQKLQPQQVQQKYQQQQQKPVPQPQAKQMIQPEKELAQQPTQLAEMHDTAFLKEKGMKITPIKEITKPSGFQKDPTEIKFKKIVEERGVASAFGYLTIYVMSARNLSSSTWLETYPYFVIERFNNEDPDSHVRVYKSEILEGVNPVFHSKCTIKVTDLYKEGFSIRIMHERMKGIANLLLGFKKWQSFAYFSSSYNMYAIHPWYPLVDENGDKTGGEIEVYFKYVQNKASNITGPVGVHYESGISLSNNGQINIQNLNPEWKVFFKNAGILPKHLKDPESLNIIMNVVGSINVDPSPSKPIQTSNIVSNNVVSSNFVSNNNGKTEIFDDKLIAQHIEKMNEKKKQEEEQKKIEVENESKRKIEQAKQAAREKAERIKQLEEEERQAKEEAKRRLLEYSMTTTQAPLSTSKEKPQLREIPPTVPTIMPVTPIQSSPMETSSFENNNNNANIPTKSNNDLESQLDKIIDSDDEVEIDYDKEHSTSIEEKPTHTIKSEIIEPIELLEEFVVVEVEAIASLKRCSINVPYEEAAQIEVKRNSSSLPEPITTTIHPNLRNSLPNFESLNLPSNISNSYSDIELPAFIPAPQNVLRNSLPNFENLDLPTNVSNSYSPLELPEPITAEKIEEEDAPMKRGNARAPQNIVKVEKPAAKEVITSPRAVEKPDYHGALSGTITASEIMRSKSTLPPLKTFSDSQCNNLANILSKALQERREVMEQQSNNSDDEWSAD